jgi:hypothetical protein
MWFHDSWRLHEGLTDEPICIYITTTWADNPGDASPIGWRLEGYCSMRYCKGDLNLLYLQKYAHIGKHVYAPE